MLLLMFPCPEVPTTHSLVKVGVGLLLGVHVQQLDGDHGDRAQHAGHDQVALDGRVVQSAQDRLRDLGSDLRHLCG